MHAINAVVSVNCFPVKSYIKGFYCSIIISVIAQGNNSYYSKVRVT